MSKPSTPTKGTAASRGTGAPAGSGKTSRPLAPKTGSKSVRQAPLTEGDGAARPAARDNQTRGTQTRGSQKYARQSATFFGRRDNSPVIFNYGRGLPAIKKNRIQQRLYLAFAAVIVVAILGVVAHGIYDYNVVQPNLPILSVNGQGVPQRMYRYMVAYLAQDNENQLQAAQKQLTDINSQINKDPSKQTTLQPQATALQTQIQNLQGTFTQTQVDQLALSDLKEDQLIQAGAKSFNKTDPKAASALNVSSKDINDELTKFKAAFPVGESYKNFLSKDNLSDDNVKSALAVKLRRNKMDQYLQSLITSPTKQIHAERIQFDNQQKAITDLAKITKDKTQWDAIAKADSIDTNTRDKGGDLGWFALSQQEQGIEQWAFDPARKVGDTSGVLKELTGSGLFNIVKILEIDPSRVLDAATVTSLKSNALSHWLTGQEGLANISSPNLDMENSPDSVPVTPIFPSTTAATPAPSVPTVGP